MDNFGFFKVRASVPAVKIADTSFNARQIVKEVEDAASQNVDCVVFPELSITAYTCADLFNQAILLKNAEEATNLILENTKDLDVIFAFGAPVIAYGKNYNCAIVAYKGNICGVVPKSYLPNYNEFYEKRWFVSGRDIKNSEIIFADRKVAFGTDIIFEFKGAKIGIEICEDLWVPQPPSSKMAMAGAQIILNLSASDDLIGKHDYLVSLIAQQSARCRCAYIYSSAGWGESSTDLVFSAKALIGYDGQVLGDKERFLIRPISETSIIDIQKLNLDRIKFSTFSESETIADEFRFIKVASEVSTNHISDPELKVDPYPFVPHDPSRLNERCEEIINIQSFGLMKRLEAINCKTAVVGISGGLDSTLALLVTVRAFDKLGLSRKDIIGITMPGLATTSRTKNNATALMEELGVTSLEIPIGKAVAQHFCDIGQDPETFDATYENSQARERTQILMDYANKVKGIVIGTGDLSELALGWCTYNGDQMSMYGVNASVPKTLVKHLVTWFASLENDKIASILKDICNTPISPELIPSSCDDIAQKTEDLVGPYELHDFYLFHLLRNSFEPIKIFELAKIAFRDKYPDSVILKWLKVFIKRFFSQQFKRSCMPDGPKVGSVSLSPRGDWRMPSDATYNIWLDQLKNLNDENSVE